MIYHYKIQLTNEGDHFIVASALDFPGCVTSGENIREAIENVLDALHGCMAVYKEEGIPLPAGHAPDSPLEGKGMFIISVYDDGTPACREVVQEMLKELPIEDSAGREADWPWCDDNQKEEDR